MNHSRNYRQSPLVPFPGQPTPRLCDRAAPAGDTPRAEGL
jgi:hypothetical protein